MTRIARRRSAFTLIEMLVVVTVIALLTALIVGVGPRVITQRKVQQTEAVISSLDRMLEEYILEIGAIPPYGVTNDYNPYTDIPGTHNTPDSTGPAIGTDRTFLFRPDAAIFIEQARGIGAADAILAGIPERFISQQYLMRDGPNSTQVQREILSVLDAWGPTTGGRWDPLPGDEDAGKPVLGATFILYVHPENIPAQNAFGHCLNNRPYFLSAGPDRRYGLPIDVLGGVGREPTPDDVIGAMQEATEDNISSYKTGPARHRQVFDDGDAPS